MTLLAGMGPSERPKQATADLCYEARENLSRRPSQTQKKPLGWAASQVCHWRT